MTTAPVSTPGIGTERRATFGRAEFRAVAAAATIAVMWIAVILVAAFGGDIDTSNGVVGTGNESHVPSSVVVALLATIATIFVARYGFRDREPTE